MMVSVAQFEREMMKERQVEGIKRAQAKGKYQRPCNKLTRLRHW
jgi:DNA invertase Pin-like site-specific DNA recombinase